MPYDYSDKKAKELRASSEKILNKLNEDQKAAAKTARLQVFEWLTGVADVIEHPETLVTEELTNICCDLFEQVLTAAAETNPAVVKLSEAWKDASDDAQLNVMQALMQSFVKKCVLNAQLVTWQHKGLFWEPIGFVADPASKTLDAKVGANPRQPTGVLDDDHYVLSEGSKLLWSREFAFALTLPFRSAFKVDRRELPTPKTVDSDDMVQESELTDLCEAQSWFEYDLGLMEKAIGTDAEDELRQKMRATMDLALIRVPRLANRFEKLADANPELGSKLENADIISLTRATNEWISMKLDEYNVRRRLESTELMMSSENVVKMRLYHRIRTVLDDVYHTDPFDFDVAKARLTELIAALPEARDVLFDGSEDIDLKEGTVKAIKWIAGLIVELEATVQPAKADNE